MFVGSKPELVKRIKEFHIQFLIHFSRKLTPSDLEFIDNILQRDVSVSAIADETVATISVGNSEALVSCRLLHELRLARPLTTDIMHIIWKMFEKRDLLIANAYREVNHCKASYAPYKESFFVSGEFIVALAANPESDTAVTDFFPTRYVFYNL